MNLGWKTTSRWKIGVLVLVGVLAINAIAGLGTSQMPTTDRFLAEVEMFSNLDRDDLAVAGGGCRGGWLGRSAYMNFRLKKGTDRLIHVELTRPLNVFGWRLAGYSDERGNTEEPFLGKWESEKGATLEFLRMAHLRQRPSEQ